jgi:cytochrome c peroxidase
VKAKLPYRARYPVADNDPVLEPVNALTVPAPRIDPRKGDKKAIAALGAALFRDKRLSKGASRACIDCHQPDKAFTDGLKAAPSLDPENPIVRNTPTLLYGPLHGAQLWDGQFASAERQALKVIHAKSEMGLSNEAMVKAVGAVAGLNAQFSQLFDEGVTAENIARALVAYEIHELVPARSPIDRFARGDDDALDEELHRGFDVFVGVGRCARCHVPPLFGGSRPTDFATPVFAALGVPTSPEEKKLDPDPGRGKVTKLAIDRHAFKTPTVRNAALTGPYFHNGAYPTLEAVVDFYEKGGAKGLGIDLDNLDPEVRELELTDGQRAALLTFMRAGLRDPAK